MLVAARRRPRCDHARFRDLPDFLRAGRPRSWSTRRRTLPAALAARGAPTAPRSTLHLSTPLPGGEPTAGSSSCAAAAEPLPRRRAPASGSRCPGGGARRRSLAPYLGPARGCGSRELRPARRRCWPTSPRHGAPIRYALRARRALAARAPTRPSTRPSPAAPRCRAPGARSRPRVVTALVARGVAVAPLVLHTGVSSLEPASARTPSASACPAATARLVDATRALAAAGSIAVGTTVVRALETRRARRTARVEAGEGWTDLVVTPSAACAPSTACSPAGTSPRPRTCDMLEAVAGRGARRALLRGRAAGRLPAGTSSATCTSSCPERPRGASVRRGEVHDAVGLLLDARGRRRAAGRRGRAPR